jgi:hypothetical protein
MLRLKVRAVSALVAKVPRHRLYLVSHKACLETTLGLSRVAGFSSHRVDDKKVPMSALKVSLEQPGNFISRIHIGFARKVAFGLLALNRVCLLQDGTESERRGRVCFVLKVNGRRTLGVVSGENFQHCQTV